ncbi:hypothetical protein GCM10008959_07610 [Deinococcus seoulensis]|uniref:Uncharacterized protein n=1 Tax=Deinococcus seoulensis TaxID=1837379 RepID=A0ABQ2RM64_9DEIO|nr:hypothetical protein GCM10008959_07610 [Deinococcus seoulensis]
MFSAVRPVWSLTMTTVRGWGAVPGAASAWVMPFRVTCAGWWGRLPRQAARVTGQVAGRGAALG